MVAVEMDRIYVDHCTIALVDRITRLLHIQETRCELTTIFYSGGLLLFGAYIISIITNVIVANQV